MNNKIIDYTIQSIKKDGLKFSVDDIAKGLKISKKTIYKIFPDNEDLAMAVYNKYYNEALNRAENIVSNGGSRNKKDLLNLYYDTFSIQNENIFNKYKLNDSVLRLATNRQQDLCDVISSILVSDNGKSLKLIIDGVFTNIINKDISDKEKTEIIERLATILWQLIL